MTSEQILGLRPCKICPRVFNSQAAAGAALDGQSNILVDAAASLAGYTNSGKCDRHQSVTCFIRKERATPLFSPNLRPA